MLYGKECCNFQMLKKKILKLLIGSNNQGKLKEIRDLLPKNILVYTPKNFNLKSPKEIGKSFLENSLIKARFFSNKTKMVTLADDSGLEIDILNGAPGIYSSRWAGKKKDFNQAMKKVHNMLYKKKTNAYYISVLAVSWSKKKEKVFVGKIFGSIIWPPKGNLGFGYDPIFIPGGYDKTFGELSNKIKNKISHRVIAFKKLLNFFG